VDAFVFIIIIFTLPSLTTSGWVDALQRACKAHHRAQSKAEAGSMKWDSCQGLLLPSRVCARTQHTLQLYSRVVDPCVVAAGMQVNAMVGASLVEAGVVKAAGTPFVNGAIKLVGNNLVGVICIHFIDFSVVVRNHSEWQ
jgi:hypothetical protein